MAGLAVQRRQKRGRATRPDLPAAGRSPSTGLSGLIAGATRAWSVAFDVTKGFRLYAIGDPARDTGWCGSEAEACQAAKAIERAM